MPPREKFKLSDRAAIAAAISAALPSVAEAANPAGRVNFAIGSVSRVSDDGGAQRLRRGSVVNSGDTIKTERGRVQIRFNDGGFMSLKPNTEFRIDAFEFDKRDDTRRRSFFSLVRGGLRTITGLIGKRDRNSYKLRTRVATIGIRGTGYGADDDGTAVDLTVLDGFVEMCNGGGCVIGAPGAVAKFVSDSARGTVTNDSSNSNTVSTAEESNDEQQEAITNEKEETNLGEQLVEVTEAQRGLPSGPGYALAIAFSDGDVVEGNFDTGLAAGDPVNATFVGDKSALVAYDGPASNVGSRRLGSNVVVEFGADSVIGWGRWINGVTTGTGSNSHPGALNLTGGSTLSHHYVVGKPTELMPQAGSAHYSLLGSTSPTLASGEGSVGTLNSADMNVDFMAATATLNLNVSVEVNTAMRTYDVSGMNMGIVGHTFASNSGVATNINECAGSGGCNVRVEGFFAGANAARAGLGYKIDTNRSHAAGSEKDKVLGVVTLQRDEGG